MTMALIVSFLLLGQATPPPVVGPQAGSLVIDGGGETRRAGKFVELAGGPDSEFVVIPTASERR